MDPDELLRRLRILTAELCSELEKAQLSGEAIYFSETELLEICEGFLNLDNWIKSGGFLPKAWNHQNKS